MTAGVFAAANESVTLAWNANPETNIAGYRLRYGTARGTYTSTVEAGKTLSATATGLNTGTTYYFTVIAYNTTGQSSTPAAELAYTTPGNPNSAPVADALTLTTLEDTSIAATLSGSDVDEDPLIYTILTPPTKGTLSGTPPNLTYQPAANANGSDSFTYLASDGALNSATVTASITITPVEDPPVAASTSVTTNEDTNVAVTLSASDPEGAALVYSLLSAPAKGSLTGTPPNLTFRPAANANGSDSFSFKVSDGSAESAPATVSITITPVNDVPVANAQSVTTLEDTPLAVTVSGSDVEGSTLTYSVVTAPGKGTLSGSLPNVTYTPAINANGSDSFVFRVNDGTANSANATVSIAITPVNDAPVASSFAVITSVNNAIAATLSATDPESSSLTYTVVGNPANGALSGSGKNLTYTPASGFTGSDSFTYRASDGTLQSALATVNVTVTQANAPPQATAQTVTVTEDTAKSITLTGSDPEGSNLSYAVVGSPSKGTISGTPPNLTYTPKLNANGADSFTFRVNDGALNSSNATVSVTITPVNDAPVAAAKSATAPYNTAVAITLSGSDVDGNSLTYSVVTNPAHGSLSGSGANLSYTPATGYTGSDSFTYRVNDGTVNSSSATVSITVVAPANLRPIAHSKTLSVLKGKGLKIQLSGVDPEAQPVSFRILNGPANGLVTGTPPNLVYKGRGKFVGTDTFTYVTNDGTMDSAPATVTVVIRGKNVKPTAVARAIVVNMNSSGAATLQGSDPEGDPLQFRVIKQPKNGTLSGTAPNLIYTPKTGFKGKDSFKYASSDGMASSAAAVMGITVVNPNNRAPVAIPAVYTTDMNKALKFSLKATDADLEPVKYRLLTKPAAAAGKLAGKLPNMTFKPKKGFTGSVTLTFLANDGTVDSGTGTITIHVVNPGTSARSLAAKSSLTGSAGTPIPLPVLKIERDAGRPGGFLLHVTGTAGARFQLEKSDDLSDWTGQGEVLIGEEGVTTLEMTIPGGSETGFYRVTDP
ncbi:Ig-like domain-containing protein [Luteolibacter sp. Populi]|uniref:Ig-like domain-containing protein n=1 Tax=Luteolibacter sp. Populi TaxID=3230487 RepID=UPI00346707CA